MDATDIYQSVRGYIAGKIDAGEVLVIRNLVDAILSAQAPITGSDAMFYQECARREVRNLIRRAIYSNRPEDCGFHYLQAAYSVKRGGEIVLVPVGLLTDAEIDLRTAEYEKMAKGCRAHAREILDYVLARSLAEAS